MKKAMILVMMSAILVFSLFNGLRAEEIVTPQQEVTRGEIESLLEKQKIMEFDLTGSLDIVSVYMIKAGLKGRIKLFLLSEKAVNNFKNQLKFLRLSIEGYEDALNIFSGESEMVSWLIFKANKNLKRVFPLKREYQEKLIPNLRKEIEKRGNS
ncbi:MAG: hypothetical protein U9P50_01825 [Patescibacteria group bacterium]|nr:hypothetical protein [Patescibacteria group bacterium]